MILLSLFITEYFAGEVAYYALDGDVFLGAYGEFSKAIDLSLMYYPVVATIDFMVWKYLWGRRGSTAGTSAGTDGERERIYMNLAACSLLVNTYGCAIYTLDATTQAYEGMLLALLILKMTLLDKALQDAGRFILDFSRRICASLVCSPSLVYATELFKSQGRAQA